MQSPPPAKRMKQSTLTFPSHNFLTVDVDQPSSSESSSNMGFNDNGNSLNEASNVTNIVVQDQNTSSSNLTNESCPADSCKILEFLALCLN